jgi:hypothetical protein
MDRPSPHSDYRWLELEELAQYQRLTDPAQMTHGPDSSFWQPYSQTNQLGPRDRYREVEEGRHRCRDREGVEGILGSQLLRVVVAPAPALSPMLVASCFLWSRARWTWIFEGGYRVRNDEEGCFFQIQELPPACRREVSLRLECAVCWRRPLLRIDWIRLCIRMTGSMMNAPRRIA